MDKFVVNDLPRTVDFAIGEDTSFVDFAFGIVVGFVECLFISLAALGNRYFCSAVIVFTILLPWEGRFAMGIGLYNGCGAVALDGGVLYRLSRFEVED